MMNLWLVTRTDLPDYDETRNVVIAAPTRKRATDIVTSQGRFGPDYPGLKTNPPNFTVAYLGVAKEGTKEGKVCHDFWHG